jgi:hypothetical protein
MTVENEINIGLAIVTALMAVATVYLAFWTHNLAKSTTHAIQQAERHHQESLRPLCVIEFFGAEKGHPFGEEFDPRAPFGPDGSEPPKAFISVRGELRNKGRGMAKDIVVYLNARLGEGEEGAYWLTRPVVVSGLIGAGETITIDVAITERDIMSVWNGVKWKPVQVFNAIAADAYEIVLQYKDVFGNFFRTVHPRGIWHDPISALARISDKAVQHDMMTRPTRAMPIFLTGKQSVRTFTDLSVLPFAPAVPPEAETTL